MLHETVLQNKRQLRIQMSGGMGQGTREAGVGSRVMALPLRYLLTAGFGHFVVVPPGNLASLVCSTVILSFWAQSVDLESECGEPLEQGKRAHAHLGWNKTEACLSTFPRGVER